LRILLASSEVVPFAKTGGLADVCGSLPIELAALGHPTAVIMPAYRRTRYCGRHIDRLGIDFIVPIGGKTVTGHLLQSSLPGETVPIYLVQQDDYFDRDDLYRTDGKDHIDNCERFVFFSRAVLEAIRLLDLHIDVLHANDWQTGLVPAYLKTEYRHLRRYQQIGSLFTIHNMAYQGQFWHWDMLLTGLDWKYFNWHQMEFHDKLNLLKTGIVFADSINTVSPRYAQEIQTQPLGSGLEGVLSHRTDVLSGIVNGADYGVWNPAADPHLPVNYGRDNWQTGKAQCKRALQKEVGLPVRADVPLLGFVGRLADQKGLDLIATVLRQWVETHDAQWVFLGEGEPKYHELLAKLAQRYPATVAVTLGFSDALAHRIEAGADMFLMPSRYEPCGLNQLYSLGYGTVPVVRATGGLADTITDASEENLAAGTANGFQFVEYSELAFEETLQRACTVCALDRKTWDQLVATGMRQDWSWTRSAQQYVELYQKTLQRMKR